jgi:class 3 adenylate cyclase/tetratricopeptide (TPR) repeat protein
MSPRGDERKVVSVLFCDLVGFTSRAERLDVEEVRGLLRPYYARLRTELERYGGTVEKFIGDAVMALFGAPISHEDDPVRAVRAALAIRNTITELNEGDRPLDLHLRIGVTTGEALVTLDARPLQGEGMASGDVVNTAARLQAGAPVDGVLVDEPTYWATKRHFRYSEAEPVRAKGKTTPVPTWQALAVGTGPAPDRDGARLVGRAAELGQLNDALSRVRNKRVPQLITLVAPPGLGKTRLLMELRRQVEADRTLVTWRQGRCLPYGEGGTLGALGEIIKSEAGILESDSAETAGAKLDQMIATVISDPGEQTWESAQLSPLIGLAGELGPATDTRRDSFAAWRRFLAALAARQPTVLIVEDLHWADALLLDFLEELIEWAPDIPLLVIATGRPELIEARPSWAQPATNRTTLTLSPLSIDNTAELVTALLQQAALPTEFGAGLLARAGGNPLYAEEYVRMLADRDSLRQGGKTTSGQRDELPLPETVQGIIAARLDALGPAEKALLQDAAVLGDACWRSALAALAGAEPATLAEHLNTLEERQLLRRLKSSEVIGESQYVFSHVLVKDVAYGLLPRTIRAERHQRAAEWLQTLAPDRSDDRIELLAYHYQTALQYSQATGRDVTPLTNPARRAMREAGDQAARLNAFASAARWYSAALELWLEPGHDHATLLLRLGRARMHGEVAGQHELTIAFDELLSAGDWEGAAEAQTLLGRLSEWEGDYASAGPRHRRAVALLERSAASPTKANVLANLAGYLMTCGRSAEAIQVARRTITIADELGLVESRMRALDFLGCSLALHGDPDGLMQLEQAVTLAVDNNSIHSAMAYANLGSVLISFGELSRGFEAQGCGRRAAQRYGLAGELRWLDAEFVLEHYLQGDWAAASTGADQFIAATEGAPSNMENVARLARGAIRLGQGDPRGADEDHRLSLEVGRKAGVPEMLYPGLAFAARTSFQLGDHQQADRLASELLDLLRQDGVLFTDPDWSSNLAVVLDGLDRGSELWSRIKDIGSTSHWLTAARSIAHGEFEEAADRYADMGSRPDEAWARLLAAKKRQVNGLPADRQLEKAIDLFRSAGATAYLKMAQTLAANRD